MKNKGEPTLFRKLIDIYYEQAQRRKALRLLAKQKWSVEFLTTLVAKAAKMSDSGVVMTITNPQGTTLTIESNKINYDKYDDSIFNHLDDATAINDFIKANSRR